MVTRELKNLARLFDLAIKSLKTKIVNQEESFSKYTSKQIENGEH